LNSREVNNVTRSVFMVGLGLICACAW